MGSEPWLQGICSFLLKAQTLRIVSKLEKRRREHLHLNPRQKDLLEQLSAEMLHVLINLFCKIFEELVHLFAFMLHDVLSDMGCFFICAFEFMSIQTAYFLCVFLANVPEVRKYRSKYTAQMFHFFFRHFASHLSDIHVIRKL